MAILGQCEAPRELSRKGRFRSNHPGSVRALTADATRPEPTPLAVPEAATRLTSVARYAPGDDEDALPDDLPPAIASEIKSIDAMRRAIETGGPIERWRFDGVRARYQALLKTGSGEPAVENAIRVRLDAA